MRKLICYLTLLCFCLIPFVSFEQDCNNWASFAGTDPGVQIGDLDIAGNTITIEALFNRTDAFDPNFFGGDIVSKHTDPTDVNYLLRPTRAEITTTTGWHGTPDACNFQLNKTYYVAMVYDGKNLKFYRNGFLMGQTPCTGNMVLNNWITRIGSTAAPSDPNPTDFHGYINEVRIWNVARTQQQLRDYMNVPLPNPVNQTGLLAYYTFDNLKNKQGNSQWDANLLNNASIKQTNPTCSSFIADSCDIKQFNVTANFTAPDTVCINAPVKITNTSKNASTYYWSFCQADLNQKPSGLNLGNVGSDFSLPTYSDIASQNGKYYVFVVNNYPGGVTRLDFGNSLLNTPTAVSLGNFGSILENNAEGIQIVNTGNHWYGIVVGGDERNNTSPQIVKLDFGTDITNINPVATDWGNVGNMSYPHKLYIFNNGGNWYGFTANYNNSTITRFDFGADFSNPPIGTNLGGFGILNGPTGLNAIQDNSKWYVFLTNAVSNEIIRLDFGTSLLNTPAAKNLGNVGGLMHQCFDIYVQKYCDQVLGFVVNGSDSYNNIIRLDFNNDLTNIPSATSLGNIGKLSFPHSFSKLFRVGNDLYTIIPNAHNNTLTRIRFAGCNNSNIPGTSQMNPPPVSYDSAGVYNISLSVDEGLPTQTSYCKQVVVINCGLVCSLKAGFTYKQTTCDPLVVQFSDTTIKADSVQWNFGNGQTDTAKNPLIKYATYGNYTVELIAKTISGCTDTISKIINVSLKKDSAIITNNIKICAGSSLQLNAINALSYCWSPTTNLSDSSIQNPVVTPKATTTYYLNSQTLGKNLVVNGSFSDGNKGFSSDYLYQPPKNIDEGVYWVGTNPKTWNGGMSACPDHTNSTGNMMMVNGATKTNINVWKQTIPVLPNTNYAFSTWIQSVYPENPAELQFSINGKLIGNIFNANNNGCIWEEFYSTWNSENSTSATISIVNMNSIKQGNDFALDDISFSQYDFKHDSVTVTVVNLPVVNAGSDTSICKGASVQLNATGALKYYWDYSVALSDSTIENPIASPVSSTKFIVKGLDNTGCANTDTVNVTVLDLPVITLVNDTAICKNGSIKLDASAPGSNIYDWFPNNNLSSTSIFNPVASPVNSTKYFVTVTDANSCENIDSVTVNVLPIPVVSTINDTSICFKDSAILQTSALYANIFRWFPSTGLDSSTVLNPQVSPITSTLYHVTAGNGICYREDSVLITVLSLPNVIAGNDTTVCDNASAYLTASGAESYFWSPVTGLSDQFISNPVATPGSTITYYVTGKGTNNCIQTDSVVVSVNPVPLFSISPKNFFVCKGDSTLLNAYGGNVYSWSPAENVKTPFASSTKIFPGANTLYKVIITDTVCKFTDSLQAKITVMDLPVLNISKSNDIDCITPEAQLTASGGVSYQWLPLTYISNSHIANPVVNPLVDTKYFVSVKDAYSCKNTDSILVKSSNANASAAKFDIPSAFTPNHDGLNDCFSVKYWGPANLFDMSIYDRWGYLVYHSNNINFCWDGTINGKPQGSGTYVYKISMSSNCSDRIINRKGTVVLIR